MRRRLLLVEDDPTLRQALSYNLTREGYEVAAALRIKERTLIGLTRAPLCLGHHIIRRVMPVEFWRH